MKALVVSLESFQKGEVPPQVQEYIASLRTEPFIILDESSKIKTNEPCKDTKKSKRTQAVLKLSRTGERCILTGTFMSKSPVNAYDQMHFLSPGFFAEGMFPFAERYCIRRNLPGRRNARVTLPKKDWDKIRARLMAHRADGRNMDGIMDGICGWYGIKREDCEHIMAHDEYTPFKNLDELWERIGDVCFKVDRKDLFDLPPKTYITRNVQLTPEQKRLYLMLEKQHCTDKVVVDNGLKLYLRFQDICNGYEPVDGEEYIGSDGKLHTHVELVPLKDSPKLDMLEQVADELGDEQFVVWCSRTRLMRDAYDRLTAAGITCGIYDGKVSKEERERDYCLFRDGKLQCLFVNQASGAYGLDGLKAADYAVYLCSDYSVEKREQSEYRTDRGGSTRSKFVIDITCRGTCEDRVVEALKQGKELLDTGTADPALFRLEDKEYGDSRSN